MGARVSGWDLNLVDIASDPDFEHSVQVDVTDEASVAKGIEASLGALGGLEGLIASAGINGPTKPTWEYSLSDWQQVLDVDLTGVFLCQISTSPFALYWLRQVVIIASVAAKDGNPGRLPMVQQRQGLSGLPRGSPESFNPRRSRSTA